MCAFNKLFIVKKKASAWKRKLKSIESIENNIKKSYCEFNIAELLIPWKIPSNLCTQHARPKRCGLLFVLALA